jgi:hypothetical protein
MLGKGHEADAAAAPAPAGITGVAAELAKQEDRCAAVEQINLQQELAAAQKEADELADSLNRQQDEIARQQEEMENLEETILDALMANLTEKTISRSGPTVASYAEKAKELLSVRASEIIEKTPDPRYRPDRLQAAIMPHLLYPDIKPIRRSLTVRYRIQPDLTLTAISIRPSTWVPEPNPDQSGGGRHGHWGCTTPAPPFVKINQATDSSPPISLHNALCPVVTG